MTRYILFAVTLGLALTLPPSLEAFTLRVPVLNPGEINRIQMQVRNIFASPVKKKAEESNSLKTIENQLNAARFFARSV